MKSFHIIVLGIFIFLAVAGLLAFTLLGGVGKGSAIGKVLVWGTLPQEAMNDTLSDIRGLRSDFEDVVYVEKDATTYDRDLIEALAAGKGPDLFLLRQDDILRYADKTIRIPYANFSKRAFQDAFIEEGELYLTNEGSVGIPFVVDPLVMYWNRDLFSTAGVSKPPQYWDEFLTLAPRLTTRTPSNTITRSAVALGEYANIPNAKELISALFMQAGTPIVATLPDGMLRSVLADKFDLPLPPAESSMNFYTEFSNPSKAAYSWNRALPNARDAFAAGDLAMYFGFASELPVIRNANANLNFAVAIIPQVRDNKTASTFGRLYAFAVSKSAVNVQGAANAALALSGDVALSKFIVYSVLPPVSRTLLGQTPPESYQGVFYQSALIARGWLDPDPTKTNNIFKTMVEDITSGRERLGEAVSSASGELESALRSR